MPFDAAVLDDVAPPRLVVALISRGLLAVTPEPRVRHFLGPVESWVSDMGPSVHSV